jgi:hypothetical protein
VLTRCMCLPKCCFSCRLCTWLSFDGGFSWTLSCIEFRPLYTAVHVLSSPVHRLCTWLSFDGGFSCTPWSQGCLTSCTDVCVLHFLLQAVHVAVI